MLLSTAMTFAINPKQEQVKKALFIGAQKAKMANKTVEKEHICVTVYSTTYDLCLNMGVSHETSNTIANVAFDTCMGLVFGPKKS